MLHTVSHTGMWLAVWSSQYTLYLEHGLAHGRVWPLRRAYGLNIRACGWPCDPRQYVCPVST
ncbi:hypothetical protein F383_32767 [Gossypium arboreum]|uniref:Uncharacterized protein n=1 Tax=Gossypium arboreum TaxID=29729 RepID=A0A0B0N2B6_GOSAR|nr:hypothetical protein F383_32767 [Gossypium arboreum]